MANTSFHGKGGSVSLDGATIANITEWSVEARCDTVDTTAMGNDNDYKSHADGFKDWTAQVEANLSGTPAEVSAQLALLGATVACIFSGGAGKPSLSGSAIVTGFNPTSAAGAAATVRFNLQGNGNLTAGTGG